MKRCKCGSTEFNSVEKVTLTKYCTVDEDGEPIESVYEDDHEYELLGFMCTKCRKEFGTWDKIPEAQE